VVMGRVVGFPRTAERAAAGFKVPHMGWNQVRQLRPHPLWKGIDDGARFYFVHSYYCEPAEPSLAVGETRYPEAFTSAIARDNIFATQFHPEKSANAGLTLLSNFSTWDP
jgi:imidazole glycerol-phosphate synthase subunit HisH